MKKIVKTVTSHPLYVKHQEKIRFVLVGGTNTVIDFTIYGLLANIFGVYAVVANMISTVICMVVSFFLNYRFVWKSKKSKKETAPKFVAMTLCSAWVVQSGVIFVVTQIFGDDWIMTLVAKALGIGVGMICNYLGYKFIFR